MAQPQPILTAEGLEEYLVEEIISLHHWGCGHQYLVQWSSYGPEHNCWIAGSVLEEYEALDRWLRDQDVDSATQ